MFKPGDLFDLKQTEHAALFDDCCYAWEALKKLTAYIDANIRPGLHNRCEGRAFIGKQVFIGEGTVVEDGVMIKGPAIIGRNCTTARSRVTVRGRERPGVRRHTPGRAEGKCGAY